MHGIPSRLQVIADQIAAGKNPEPETVRSLLQWFEAQRRRGTMNAEAQAGSFEERELQDE